MSEYKMSKADRKEFDEFCNNQHQFNRAMKGDTLLPSRMIAVNQDEMQTYIESHTAKKVQEALRKQKILDDIKKYKFIKAEGLDIMDEVNN